MQRLRSTFNLLSDDNPQLLKYVKENPYNHLEQSSWSQILSSEAPSQNIHQGGQNLQKCLSPPNERSTNDNATKFLSNAINRSDQQDDFELRCNIPESVHQNGYHQETPLDLSSTRSKYVVPPDEHRSSSNDRFERDFQGGSEHLHNFLKNAFQNGHCEDSSLTCSECVFPLNELRSNIHDRFNQQDDFEHRHNIPESVHRNGHPVGVSLDVPPVNTECVAPPNKHRNNILDRFSHDVQNTFEHQHNILKNVFKNDHVEESSLAGSESMISQDYYDSVNATGYRNNVLDRQDGFEHNSLQSDIWSRGNPEEFQNDISSMDSEMSCAFDRPVSGTLLPDNVPIPIPYPVVNPFGHASLLLRHLVRVDINPDGALYIHNFPGQSTVALNGDKICIFHPNGRVFIDGCFFHVATYQNRIAKICPRGITFSSSSRSLAYRVDESGTKTTADKFLKLRDDLPLDVFRSGKLVLNLKKCGDVVENSTHVYRQNGDDIWVIGGIQVKQDCYGNIEVSVGDGRQIVRVLPVIGEVSVETAPFFIATIGCYSKRYLTVQVGNRKVTSGICGLIARNGSQKAGLDRYGKVVIF